MHLGDEPPDVISYHRVHPAFPHQSAEDQPFDEPQMESYRMLGHRTVDEILRGWDPKRNLAEVCRFVDGAYLAVRPAAPVMIADVLLD
jgi:hypothetical protein